MLDRNREYNADCVKTVCVKNVFFDLKVLCLNDEYGWMLFDYGMNIMKKSLNVLNILRMLILIQICAQIDQQTCLVA